MSAAIDVKRHVLAKIEGTYATDPVPVVGSDAMIVKNLSINPHQLSLASRADVALQGLGRLSSKTAASMREISFDVEVSGASAAGVAPPYGPLLRACALGQTVVTDTSVTYAPISSAFEGVTIYANKDGMLYKFIGARGNVSLVLNQEDIPVWRFRFVALYSAPTDTAFGALTLSAWQTPLPMNKTNTTSISLHGYACGLLAASIDLGNNPQYTQFPGGSEQVFITQRAPTAEVTIEMPTVAQKDYDAIMESGAEGSFTFVHGSGAGRILTVTAAQTRIVSMREGNYRGIRTMTLGLELAPSLALNTEVSFAHT